MTNEFKKNYTPVRFSHLTKYASVGAIVRGQNDVLMFVKDISNWPVDKMLELHAVERVKKYFSITSRLMMPPEATIDHNSKVQGGVIPTEVFPKWMVCNACNKLHYKPWLAKKSNITAKYPCPSCSKNTLTQVTWCAVSSIGGLTEVPWHSIAHSKNSFCRPKFGESYLEIISNQRGKFKIRCTECNSEEYFEQVTLSLDKHYQASSSLEKKSSSDKQKYTIMEVNDPRVHIPVSQSALVIPPESDIDRNSLVFQLLQQSHMISRIKNARNQLEYKKTLNQLQRQYKCDHADIMCAIDKIDELSKNESIWHEMEVNEMLYDEFQALTLDRNFSNEADFITSHKTKKWLEYLSDTSIKSNLNFDTSVIEQLVAVERLRVIEVSRGFERVANDIDEFEERIMHSPDFTNTQDWLPAIELFGEGLFISLSNKRMTEWEQDTNVINRVKEIQKRFEGLNLSIIDEIIPTARFIFLHTLAHILIREIETFAGYPAASLQERIYSDSSKEMAGILVYTAVPDIAGSLGGIVELAEPQKFMRILDAAIRRAHWCSMDPVCSETYGQGPNWLNRAACHGCALVPDTSCRYNNIFLDRVLVKGNSDKKIRSIFNLKD